ncbi:MAG: hypothetical protein HY727_21650 [Candidatus Rokubacteria bacterium]|nr:hypothetical protein [Candidatus Rokubacteria bacterium]
MNTRLPFACAALGLITLVSAPVANAGHLRPRPSVEIQRDGHGNAIWQCADTLRTLDQALASLLGLEHDHSQPYQRLLLALLRMRLELLDVCRVHQNRESDVLRVRADRGQAVVLRDSGSHPRQEVVR